MAIFGLFGHVFRTFYIHGQTTAFRWYNCQWPCAYFKVIGLFHINNNNNNNTEDNLYGAVITHHDLVIARVHPVHAMDAEQPQVAADLWTKSTELSHKPACRQLRHYIHLRYLLLLSPKADTHFTIARSVEGWVGVWFSKSYYRQLIGNHTLAFDWCHFWWPWSTFEGHSA